MQRLIKTIDIVSTAFLAVGLCGLCSVQLSDNAPLSTFFKVYGILMLIFALGALGIQISHNPNKYFSIIYAAVYAIVNTIYVTVHKIYQNMTMGEKFGDFFYEGLDIYDEYYYI